MKRRADAPHETESPVLAGLLKLLEVLGIPAARSNAGGGYRLGKGGRPQLIMGMPQGWPDITGWLPRDGRFLGIEAKAPGNVPSAPQWERIHRINRDGGVAFWADDVAACHKILALVMGGASVTYEDPHHPGRVVITMPEGGPR
jgi:hypothetical protein